MSVCQEGSQTVGTSVPFYQESLMAGESPAEGQVSVCQVGMMGCPHLGKRPMLRHEGAWLGCPHLGKRPMLRHEGLWLGCPQQRDKCPCSARLPVGVAALSAIQSMNVFSQRAPTRLLGEVSGQCVLFKCM